MSDTSKRCSVKLKDVHFLFQSCPRQLKHVRSKRCSIKDQEVEMTSQNRKWCQSYPDCPKFDTWKQNSVCGSCNLASRNRKFFHGIKHNEYKSTRTTKRHSYSVQFFTLLCSQTGRIRKNFKCSNLLENRRIIRTGNYLNRLLTPVNWHLERATMSLQGNCRRICLLLSLL